VVTVTHLGERVPALPSAPIIGAAFEVRKDFLGTSLRAAREVGDIVRIVAGPPGWRMTLYSVAAPELVFEILGHPDRFDKDIPSYREMRWAFGNGMLTSEGEVWHRQRRFLAPIFTAKRITSQYAPVMAEEAARLVERWRAEESSGVSVDANAEMVNLTTRIIGRILFGADVSLALPQIKEFKFVSDELLRRGLAPHPVPRWIPTPANRQLAEGLAEIRGLVAKIIAGRRSQAAPTADAPDMLGMLLQARDDQNREDRLTDAEVADQILIFLLAGHDTTGSTLACLLVELARSPYWQSTVRDEVHGVLAGRLPTAEDIPRLVWTGRTVREGMRMYPAAHSIGRSAKQDENLNGFRIPAGSIVVVSPWAVHHSAKIWPKPDTFDPRRFDVPSGKFPGGHKYAWFPFGAGPRACVGMQLAMVELPIVLATILSAFHLTTDLTSVPVDPAISLHPASALPVMLRSVSERPAA
jgi:cytochrome P450